jgi:crossover junction endodeoxyribonuclease RuvC
VGGGVIRPPTDAPLPERLLAIELELTEIIGRHDPGCCAIESVYYHKNPKSMLTLGQAQAAAILATAHASLGIHFYSPSEIKQAVTGGGRAGKEQVRFMVERILGITLDEQADDASDALAVAICHAGREPVALAGRP